MEGSVAGYTWSIIFLSIGVGFFVGGLCSDSYHDKAGRYGTGMAFLMLGTCMLCITCNVAVLNIGHLFGTVGTSVGAGLLTKGLFEYRYYNEARAELYGPGVAGVIFGIAILILSCNI